MHAEYFIVGKSKRAFRRQLPPARFHCHPPSFPAKTTLSIQDLIKRREHVGLLRTSPFTILLFTVGETTSRQTKLTLSLRNFMKTSSVNFYSTYLSPGCNTDPDHEPERGTASSTPSQVHLQFSLGTSHCDTFFLVKSQHRHP